MVLAPVRFVGSHQDAFGRHDGVDRPQRRAPALRKQAAAGAEHEGGSSAGTSSIRSAAMSAAINSPAAHDHEIAARCSLELGHRGRDITVQKRRVRPSEPRRGVVRSDVLLSVVERVHERPILAFQEASNCS